MKRLTREWVKKAEGDFRTASREWRVRKDPTYDAVCFHAHQCVEKYLKARLQEAAIPIEKTHNLIALLDVGLQVQPLWEAWRNDLAVLSASAVAFRYPGDSADKETAREAILICRRLRKQIRESLGLRRSAKK